MNALFQQVRASFSSRSAIIISSLFVLAVGTVMAIDYGLAKRDDPLESRELKRLKEELQASPTSDPLKQQIRALDFTLRERYFSHLTRMNSGVWLLLAGAGVLIFALGQQSRKPSFDYLRKGQAQAAASEGQRFATASLSAVGFAGVAMASFLGWLAFAGPKTQLPGDTAQVDKFLAVGSEASAPDCAPASEMARNWPRFRGASGNGVDSIGKAPAEWNANSGAGVLWKVPAPSQGFNSPIVFGDRIFFSGGTATTFEVVSLRLTDGQVAWRKTIEPPAGAKTSEVPESTGCAPATMATDGRRVYAIFANGVLGALNLDGTHLWTKSFGELHNPYGHAISLLTHQDRLIVQLDQGESGEGKSVLYAFQGATGRIAWQKVRPLGASWASPILIEAAGKRQIITVSVPLVISHSADNGAELWRADCLNGEVTPSPIFTGNRLLIPSPSDRIVAIRPDGQGDVTKTHIEWGFDEDIPDVTSPVSNGELLFFVTTSGTLTCVDLKDGSKVWTQDLSFECHASPAISGNRLYQFGQDGSVVVAEVAREYKEVFRDKLPDSFHASPAFVADTMVVRGMTNVWRFGQATSIAAAGK